MLNIQKDQFEKLVNSAFSIQFEPEVQLDAELIEVEEKDLGTQVGRKPFSLLFKTNQTDQYYRQGTYKVSHKEIEDVLIFLSPIGPTEGGMLYEAVFS